MNKSSVAYSQKAPDARGVKDAGRIVVTQGREFWSDFIGQTVLPMRREIASMLLAQQLHSTPLEQTTPEHIDKAFQLADDFLLHEKSSLAKKLSDYWDLYMERGDLEDVLKVAIENSKDFSL